MWCSASAGSDARPCPRRVTTPIDLGAACCRGSSALRFSDTQCGFRVFRVDALRGISLRARGYDIETEMLVKLSRRRARITTVPVTAVYAGQRSKLRPVRDTTRTCFLAVYYRFIERI